VSEAKNREVFVIGVGIIGICTARLANIDEIQEVESGQINDCDNTTLLEY